MKDCLDQCLRVQHGEEAEGCDAVYEPCGGSWPHLTSPHDCRLVRALGVKDNVLCAEGLIRAWQRMVGSSTQGLCHIAVGLRLPAQELTSSLPDQLGDLVFRRRLKGAEEEEETAIEEWRELWKDDKKNKTISSISENFCVTQKSGREETRYLSSSSIKTCESLSASVRIKPPCENSSRRIKVFPFVYDEVKHWIISLPLNLGSHITKCLYLLLCGRARRRFYQQRSPAELCCFKQQC